MDLGLRPKDWNNGILGYIWPRSLMFKRMLTKGLYMNFWSFFTKRPMILVVGG